MGLLMTIIVLALKTRLRPILRVFFGYVDLNKKRVNYPSVMNFEGNRDRGHMKFVIYLPGL
jgi:hypothetical protein